jgi:hypothetical protein
MKSFLGVGITLAALLTVPAAAQMMHGGGDMGGGRHTAVNLVSPTDAATQVRRGVLIVGQQMSMMQVPATPTAQEATPRVWLILRLSGVSDGAGLVTSAGNRLRFDGRLATAAGGESPIAIDQEFALRAGAALVQVAVPVPSLSESARILIDSIAVLDVDGDTFAVPGVLIAPPIASATPAPTPSAGCSRSSDCDDHNPDTRDLCMLAVCVHMPSHMGGGPMM